MQFGLERGVSSICFALSKRLAFSVWNAEDVAFRRHHHVVEVLGEHRGGEESDGAQCFLTDINEGVFYRRWNRFPGSIS